MLDLGGLYERVRIGAARLSEELGHRRPKAAFVLGSALGSFADAVADPVSVSFAEIPYLRTPTAAGHAGRFVAGTVEGLDVVAVSGRLHGYEGYQPDEVTFPIRLVAALGSEIVVLTNAAGGVDPSLVAGDLMVVDDHLNLAGSNPLRGPNDDRLGPRFPDMTNLYDAALRERLDEAAEAVGIELRHGVYAGLAGPSYETPAEVRMLRTLGADAVGMSTVAEAIVARHAGLGVACVSCITNAALGAGAAPLSHDEVMRVAASASNALTSLLRQFCASLATG